MFNFFGKEGKVLIFILPLFFFLFSLASAAMNVGNTNARGVVITQLPQAPINYSIVNVNSSQYWDNLNSPSDISHNDLANKQGGQIGEYYHLNVSLFNQLASYAFNWITSYINIAFTNQTNSFQGNQTILGLNFLKANQTFAISQKQCFANFTDECAFCSYSNGTAKIEESPCGI